MIELSANKPAKRRTPKRLVAGIVRSTSPIDSHKCTSSIGIVSLSSVGKVPWASATIVDRNQPLIGKGRASIFCTASSLDEDPVLEQLELSDGVDMTDRV
ncbi:MAG: hypothetical protein VYA30_16060 [Myxococcota bacterium]|nr:hypothetical protein [Myxococcota bacterium]